MGTFKLQHTLFTCFNKSHLVTIIAHVLIIYAYCASRTDLCLTFFLLCQK